MRRRSDSAARPLNAYVYAFVSGPPGTVTISRRSIDIVPMARLHVALEWRDDPPEVTPEALARQHRIVERLGEERDAVVPARFGSLVPVEALKRLLQSRGADLRRALAQVRGCVQMTVRIPTESPAMVPSSKPATGTEYLDRRRASRAVAASPAASAITAAVEPLIIASRAGLSSPSRLTLFHLIRRADVRAYRARVRAAAVDMAPAGPFPPFAFAPDLWA